MTLHSLRPYLKHVVMPIVKVCEKLDISANAVSAVSFFFAAFAGIAFYFSQMVSWNYAYLTLIGGLCVFMNAFFDAIDGELARYTDSVSKWGDFLDHVIDRYADVFIISGIVFGGFMEGYLYIGVIALVGILLTSYLGTQTQAIGIGRNYGGILGRADRLVLVIVGSIANFIYPYDIYWLPVLGWIVVVFAVTSHITALQRFMYVRKELR
ncbi:MAG: CDP-alcohol phosphatidyltransferase family protein [Methanosarcinales archaeon]|nr:CDP-alcohol phosphatidyltransferase family protein [Methanosarcinales archaeon]